MVVVMRMPLEMWGVGMGGWDLFWKMRWREGRGTRMGMGVLSTKRILRSVDRLL